jgi:cytochrome c biogenesis protein CcmG/thiol:disulfide interchange protein DsbE
MTETAAGAPSKGPRRLIFLLPLVLFAALAVTFYFGFSLKKELPSVLIGREVPRFTLAPLEGMNLPGLATEDLRGGRVTLVNVWASWCVPCRDEHPHLMALEQDRSFDIVGINNKDAAENARRFLGQLGNPFSRIGVDGNGRASIEWGVYGVPETFVVNGEGRIVYKHVGPIDRAIVEGRILPAIRAAQGPR